MKVQRKPVVLSLAGKELWIKSREMVVLGRAPHNETAMLQYTFELKFGCAFRAMR